MVSFSVIFSFLGYCLADSNCLQGLSDPDSGYGNRLPGGIEPRQRAHSPSLAAGLAGQLKIDVHPYGAPQHWRCRQNIPRGLPRGGLYIAKSIGGVKPSLMQTASFQPIHVPDSHFNHRNAPCLHLLLIIEVALLC